MASVTPQLLLLQFILYSCMGLVACAIDLGFFSLFKSFLPLLVATSLSFIIATAINYLLSYGFIFGRRSNHLNQIFRLFWVALVGLGLNTSLFALLTTATSFTALYVKILVVPVVMVWNFLARRTFVYSPEIPMSTLLLLNRLLRGRLAPFLDQ